MKKHTTVVCCFLLLLMVTRNLFSAQGLHSCWEHLVHNRPLEAKEAFGRFTEAADEQKRGAAFRGLATVSAFLGNSLAAADYTFKAFLADQDTTLFNATWIHTLAFSRSYAGHSLEDGYKVFEKLTQTPSLYNGESQSSYINRYINDGNVRIARKLLERMGVVKTFRMCGPFENISGSGYAKMYPPEKTISFDSAYTGKNGAEVRWFPFVNNDPSGWLFTDANYMEDNAVLYYYTNIISSAEKTVYLGFGASGSFKVFFNDNLVLADSVFRNTGTDMFMQKVRLIKGDNKLLIKLCHEERHSNFLVRFVDQNGNAVEGVSYSGQKGTFVKDTTQYDTLLHSPISQKVIQTLTSRLQKDSTDLEAALLLMHYYNAAEFTDRGQKLARTYLRRYPESSIWYGYLHESLQRSGKDTRALTAIRSAYRLCPYNASAWQSELEVLSATASSRDILQFLEFSPKQYKESAEFQAARFLHSVQVGNETAALDALHILENNHATNGSALEMLVSYYIGQGRIEKAKKMVERYLKRAHASPGLYEQLADLYLNTGKRKKAMQTYRKRLQFLPNSPDTYYYLARLSLQLKEFDEAEQYAQKALKIMPVSANLYNLLGSIYLSRNNKDKAIEAFEQAIKFQYNNFSAWDQLLPLRGQPDLLSLAPLPSPDSLLFQAGRWDKLDGDNGVVVSYVKDVFLYPSRCSRERTFMMVYMSSQASIDIWKEYSISYNGYYQALDIARAVSIGKNGRETPADVSGNNVVFKTLKPGDCILLEWSLENYYNGEMAGQVWGDFEFSLPYPVFSSQLRLVTPAGDTIPYTVTGDSVTAGKESFGDFIVTRISRDPYSNPARETFTLVDPPSANRVYYSSVKSWKDISNWYLNLTQNKIQQSTEVKAIADSLFAGANSVEEKVRRMHEFITGTVRYSFVPFRQSGWVPQSAQEVLSTRIGDCKDMASLGKALLDHEGIDNSLVLVNTRDRNSIYPSYIGPNFNHAILSYISSDGNRRFVDLTHHNLSVDNLPKMDQGALALVVSKDNDSLIHLPVDTSHERTTYRHVRSRLDSAGALYQEVQTTRTGIFAGRMRSIYRFLAPEERKKHLQKVLAENFPNAHVQTLAFGNLDSLRDTIRYSYRYMVPNAARFSGKAGVILMHLPDRITGGHYPSEQSRHYDIDMAKSWFDVGEFTIDGELELPPGWSLISLPKPVELESAYGKYECRFEAEGNKIRFYRKARFTMNEPISAQQSDSLRRFLSKVAQADDFALMFYTDDTLKSARK